MADEFIKIELENTEDLKRRLGDPELFNQALKILGSRAASAGKREGRRQIQGGLGVAQNSIVSRVWPREGMALVKTMMPLARAVSIEEGHPPGDPPKLGSMIAWVEAVGHPEDAAIVRGEIAARGSRGKKYLQAVIDVWDSSMTRWLKEAAERIEKRFNRGR